jgi:hypothetical protein
MGADEPNHDDWASYGPLDGPRAVVCSFCGRGQDESLVVLANADGSAAICEECNASHAVFFARRHQSPR